VEGAATILLIRHAHIDCSDGEQALLCGRYDACLSERGREQIRALREQLLDERPLTAVYSSPLRRALNSARAAPPEIAHTVRTLNSLREIDCGILEGMPLSRVEKEYPATWRQNNSQNDEDFSWPGGESYRRFRRRVLRVLNCLARTHLNERVLVFTHAGVINQAIGSINGQTPARWENYRPPNASITELLWSREGPRLVRFGDCRHLSASSHPRA
jgi:broad specificity phosphatase PhoE